MKKTIILSLMIFLVFSIIIFSPGCKGQEIPEVLVEEVPEENGTNEEGEQAQETLEEEAVEQAGDQDAPVEATEEDKDSDETAGEEQATMEYSLDSIMGELLDNPDTREVLEKHIPEVVNSDRIDESRAYALSLVLRFSDVEDSVIEMLEKDLKNLGIKTSDKAEVVSYSVKFEALWSIDTHPDDYVGNAHFSPFVIYSFNGTDEGRIFILDLNSSPGMEEMAETGATGILIEEIDQIIEANNAFSYVKAGRIDSPGQTEAVLELTNEFSRFIFVSMIAPSPDWFVAGEDDLFKEGQWVDQIVIELITYDAGTDSGETLTAADADTDPKEQISIFDESLQNMGTITITKN